MKVIDKVETISEQDYGTWFDRATLYQSNNNFYLEVEGGYGEPYVIEWYKLSDKPTKTLEEAFGGTELYAGAGQYSLFEDELEVSCIPIAPPD